MPSVALLPVSQILGLLVIPSLHQLAPYPSNTYVNPNEFWLLATKRPNYTSLLCVLVAHAPLLHNIYFVLLSTHFSLPPPQQAVSSREVESIYPQYLE